MTMRSPFRYFKTSPGIIRLAVMMCIRFPLSLQKVEDLLRERGINISHETVRFWWQRFGPMFAAEIRKRRIQSMRSSLWRWHLDEMIVKIIGNAYRQECSRWLSNRAENSHLRFRRREQAMLRFRQMRSLQEFTAVHASVYNLFNTGTPPFLSNYIQAAPRHRPFRVARSFRCLTIGSAGAY